VGDRQVWSAIVVARMALLRSRTNPDLVAARFLLKPDREYKDAVKECDFDNCCHEFRQPELLKREQYRERTGPCVAWPEGRAHVRIDVRMRSGSSFVWIQGDVPRSPLH